MKDREISSLSKLSFSLSIFTTIILSFIATPPDIQAQNSKLPSLARVTAMNAGDLACYVDLVDNKGKKYEGVYAIFEICELESTFLNKRVRLSYRQESFNDCESAEPCGKTKLITAISQMQLVR